MYHVVFEQYSAKSWFWKIMYGKNEMARSIRKYSTLGGVRRAFWRIMSDDVCQEIEANYL